MIRIAVASFVTLLAILFWAAAHRVVAEPMRVDVAIVLVQDTSSSMDMGEMMMARQSYVQALTSFNVVYSATHGEYGRVAVAYVEFNSTASVVLPWTVIDSPESAQAVASDIGYSAARFGTGSTNIGAGLEMAQAMLAVLPYQATRLVVDVVGDGVGDHGGQKLVRAELIDAGVTINGLPMTLSPDLPPCMVQDVRMPAAACLIDYYTRAVVGGPGAFLMPISDVNELPLALTQKISRELY